MSIRRQTTSSSLERSSVDNEQPRSTLGWLTNWAVRSVVEIVTLPGDIIDVIANPTEENKEKLIDKAMSISGAKAAQQAGESVAEDLKKEVAQALAAAALQRRDEEQQP